MQGYHWAKTPQNELFVVLIIDGEGYVPALETAINLGECTILERIEWPAGQLIAVNQNSPLSKRGGRAPDAMRECAILPFVASA